MSFVSLSMGKLYKKSEEKRLKNIPAGYIVKFYRNPANNVDTFLGYDFYVRIANNADIRPENVQKYILGNSDFYLTRDKISNASFRQRLDPISKNILRRQNPLELIFEDISIFDTENPIDGSLLRELDVGKKDKVT